MCGIFGIAVTAKSDLSHRAVKMIARDLFLYSASRGKEASGIATVYQNQITVAKTALPASAMIRSKPYKQMMAFFKKRVIQKAAISQPFLIIGHSRLATTGIPHNNMNNQPVITDDSIGIHNGIILNYTDLWNRYPGLSPKTQLDSEIIFRLISMFYQQDRSLISAIQKTFFRIKGIASIAVLFNFSDHWLIATNNGSMYYGLNTEQNVMVFGSERHFLQKISRRRHFKHTLHSISVEHLLPGHGLLINTIDMGREKFVLHQAGTNEKNTKEIKSAKKIVVINNDGLKPFYLRRFFPKNARGHGPIEKKSILNFNQIEKQFPHDTLWQKALKRCTKCILPETMPFIRFDQNGVCNYCHSYHQQKLLGEKKIQAIAKRYRNSRARPDCVVGVSGGRDSLYSLHYIKTQLRLNPVAYTYDWGMVTDLARRNISRICWKLGIEHIIVSADINKKRRFIRKNVSAWLEKPQLGMIPLFMAGDKHYFYYLHKICQQNDIKCAILGENLLERTHFKTGFAGIPPYHLDTHHVYTLPPLGKIKLSSFYLKAFLLNKSYINASIMDSMFAAICYYSFRRHYINLYSYIPWIEETVIKTLTNEYDFERASDTSSTWRIGDGTSAFYNYIYYHAAGFTENDTFRSNQIREGLITRKKALAKVAQENKPRFETIAWYLHTIDLGFRLDEVLDRIQSIPKLTDNRGHLRMS